MTSVPSVILCFSRTGSAQFHFAVPPVSPEGVRVHRGRSIGQPGGVRDRRLQAGLVIGSPSRQVPLLAERMLVAEIEILVVVEVLGVRGSLNNAP